MTTAPITDEDERLHPVEDPSPHWSDSLYFNAWDPGTDAFLMSRIAVRANEPAATAGMVSSTCRAIPASTTSVRWCNVQPAIGTPAGVYRTGSRSTTLAVSCSRFM